MTHRILLPVDGRHLLAYQTLPSGRTHLLRAPRMLIDGAEVLLAPTALHQDGRPDARPNGVVETAFRGPVAGRPDLELRLALRQAEGDPVVRFRWELHAARPVRLGKRDGHDALEWFGADLAGLEEAQEVRFSEFNELYHSYVLEEIALAPALFSHGEAVMGPLLTAGDRHHHLLLAYEHGSQSPDAFLRFHLAADRSVALRSVKGSYWGGQTVAPGSPYIGLWLEIAAVDGDRDCLARHYRDFALRHLSENAESRKPYVYYNTWCHQERTRHWRRQAYLTDMHLERMLAEIDAAARIGIDVFVIDTGWYERCGDWRVDAARFPDGLRRVKERLDAHGMRLGLWFAPTTAALASGMLAQHRDCQVQWQGGPRKDWVVWETEASNFCCLASRYRESFADELVRLSRDLGVTYFKWDAVGQYDCDAAGHLHGDAACPPQERADCYAFQQPLHLAAIAERIRAQVPEAICDFDITEGGRCVGLAFLAASKFFLLNNGPYYGNLDIAHGADSWGNVFVRPGPARGWICRTPLSIDRWLPSTCFLAHYLPDDPSDNQHVCVASLILGHNGIWGDLPEISPAGVALLGELIGQYKRVRDAIAAAYPVRQGQVGGSPEVHEKLAVDGRGAVVLFASHAGTVRYRTVGRVAARHWATADTGVAIEADGTALIEARFERASARIAFFG